MKYLSQCCIIFAFSLVGEILQRIIPLPIPASVYGLVLLFAALSLKIVRLDQVKEAGDFLRSLLPLLFVIPTVGIIQYWDLILPRLGAIVLILTVSTLFTFGISGTVTRLCSRKGGSKND